MKKIGIILLLFVSVCQVTAQTEITGGNIFTNETWNLAGSPYIIKANTVLFSGKTLTIEPGVTVKFDNGVDLNIQGTLIAQGTENDSIIFTSNNPNPMKSSWKEILIDFNAKFIFEYVSFNYSTNGVKVGHTSSESYIKHSNFRHNHYAISSSGGSSSGVLIENTNIYNSYMGIGSQMDNFILKKCSFINNQIGASLDNSQIDSCLFENNSEIGLTGSKLTINQSTFTGNKLGVDLIFSDNRSTFIDNQITQNTTGLRISGSKPDFINRNNSFCNNSSLNVENRSANNVDLSNNCWCTADLDVISASISDKNENSSYGVVTFAPIKMVCDFDINYQYSDNFTASCQTDLPSNTPQLSVYVENDSIIISPKLLSHKCCAEFALEISELIDDTLYVNFEDTTTQTCDCVCDYEIKINAGKYETTNPLLISYNGNWIRFYHKDFAPTGATWYYDEQFASSADKNYIQFTSEKDTLINGEFCKKITKRHRLECNNRPDAEFVFTRNDTVYFLDTIFNEFQPLYIFSAKVSDKWTIKIKDENGELDNILVTVDTVSTMQINGESLRTLDVTYEKKDEKTHEPYTSTIIEKIGDINYMFNWDPWSAITCDINFTAGLICYHDAQIGDYSTGVSGFCGATPIIENKLDNTKIQVFPNPANSYIEIVTDFNSEIKAELRDLTGKLIIAKSFRSNTTIDLQNTSSGMYILTLRNKHKILGNQKIVKK